MAYCVKNPAIEMERKGILVLELGPAAENVLRRCLKVSPSEVVLVVTDEACRVPAFSFWEKARELGCEAVLAEIKARVTHGEEPPAPVAQAMRASQVCLLVTSKSLSHTKARREACCAGSRIASLPGITSDMMARTLDADYGEIADFTLRVAAKLADSRDILVTTPSGTHLSLRAEGRPVHPDTGIYAEPGAFGNLPAGEVYLAPLEGTATGVVVIDGSIAGVGLVDVPVRVEIRDGLAGEITGGKAAQALRSLLDSAGREARNVGELGLGTNSRATLVGNILEDEKVLGTAHIAFGSNATFGGMVSVASHLDGILLRPTVVVDGRVLVRDGSLLV